MSAEEPAGSHGEDRTGLAPPVSADTVTHTVVFTPSGFSGAVESGSTVLEAARQLGADLDSVCGGRGICGRCQITPAFGEHSKWGITATADHLSAPGALEATYRGRRPLGDNRLGCVAQITGDMVVDVPATSQLHRPVVRKDVTLDGLVLDPVLTLHYLELSPRDEEDGTDALTLVREQLAADWGIGRGADHIEDGNLAGYGAALFDYTVAAEPQALAMLAAAVETGSLTVALRRGSVAAAWPGFVDRVVGLAVDVGSTTVAGHLCDLTTGEVLATAGRMNPQIRFGEDLMSRVSYVMLNDGGADQLTGAIRTAMAELCDELLDAVDGVDASHLLEVVAVGNPIMHHLLLGLDPTPLGQSPFRLAVADPVDGPASMVGIDAPSARVHVGPCIAGHVGADTAAAILHTAPHRSDHRVLLVDVGTNAEIVLGSRHGLLAASSPTGPAFEGAQISSGQRATAGAIERVRVDRLTLEPRIKVIGVEPWSDEEGFTEAVAATGVTGICGSGIIEVVSELFLSGAVDAQGVIVSEAGARSPRIVPDGRTFAYRLADNVMVTQNDIRAIQLAKAALRAGIELLMDRAGTREVDEIHLAGAFGAHIDPVHAMVLGLIPDCPVDRVKGVGNAAGSGAVRALLSGEQRAEMARATAGVTKVETATEPAFQEHFVAALALPHRDAPNPNLSTAIDLPEQAETHPVARTRGRRRRARARSEQSAQTEKEDQP
ncbi:MAG: ASKHA domain-containing protein [Actinomycetota bacterium]